MELYFQVAIPKMFDESSEDVKSSLVDQQGRAAFRRLTGQVQQVHTTVDFSINTLKAIKLFNLFGLQCFKHELQTTWQIFKQVKTFD